MATEALDKQISKYLPELSQKQKLAVLAVVKTFAEENESNLEDPLFIKEMDRRIEELESGKVKGSTWEAVKQRARQSMSKDSK